MADLRSLHARVFETRWGQVLVMLEDNEDGALMVFRLWQPVGEDGSIGMIEYKMGCGGGVAAEAHDRFLDAAWNALPDTDTAKVEASLEAAGLAELLDGLRSGDG